MIWYYTFRNWQYAHWVSCISVFDMNWWDLWSGVEDCSSPSVWCKTTQRRHCSDDHLKSCWWGFFGGIIHKTVVGFLFHNINIGSIKKTKQDNIVFLCRPAAPLCLPCLLSLLPAAVWSCLQQRHRSKVPSFASFAQLSWFATIVLICTIVLIILSCFRCWTAGWGKDEFSGSFQFIQHKVGSEWKWQHQRWSCWKSTLIVESRGWPL